MKILAIEASSLVCSTAILTDDIITAEYTINNKVTHSQTLLPMIDEICKMTDTNVSEFDAIAVSGGPGSFTGLRIGSATAKGLAYALNVPVVNVPTLEAMAYNFYGTDKVICPIMDARRNQVYTGIYSFENNGLSIYLDSSAMDIMELIPKLQEIDKPVIFTGDGIPVFRDIIDKELKTPHEYGRAGFNRQRASSVALLGAELYKAGKTEKAEEHLPEYLRMSQAERERMDKVRITIRYMEPQDTEKVAYIEKNNFSEPWPESEFSKTLQDDKYIYIVAADGERIAGYAGCFVVLENADITNIAVDEEYRRQGIGDRLIELLSLKAADKGAESLFLEVRESNEPAKSLYEKNGFAKVGMRRNFYRKPDENAILMEKKLIGKEK